MKKQLIKILVVVGVVIAAIPTLKAITKTNSTNVNEMNRVRLERVVDGDTLYVVDDASEYYVRLIGIDAPESVNPDESKNTEEGIEASNYVKELMADVEYVYLEYDVEKEDVYERILAYVWYYNDEDELVMLNQVILSNGYAVPLQIYPNIKYKNYLNSQE